MRLLVYEFGVNPPFKDGNGRTTLDVLTATLATMRFTYFKTTAQHAEWQANVAATTEILRRDRDVMVVMGHLSPASPLHHLEAEMLRNIMDSANREDDAGIASRSMCRARRELVKNALELSSWCLLRQPRQPRQSSTAAAHSIFK